MAYCDQLGIAEVLKQIKFVVRDNARRLFEESDENKNDLLELAEVSASSCWSETTSKSISRLLS